MRILVGVDLSDQAFAAVEQIGLLYRADEIVIVHGVAQAANLQGTVELRQALLDAGRTVVERCRTLLPAETSSIRTLCEAQDPVPFILESAAKIKPDLIVMGTRGRSRMMEVFGGSVSHRILLHATVPTLIVKAKTRPINHVLIAVQGREDATRLQTWLTAHPFKNPVAVTILSVVSPLHDVGEQLMVELESWSEQSKRDAEQVVNDMAKALASPDFTVSTDVRPGDPVSTVCEVGQNHDLIVLSSHGRKGVNRFMLGSVSEKVVHRAKRSVLVVR
ncbi:MAG TPA: universal stress protein [Nitrospiraceae bacterium]|nr:universal stress protein [Nitrospiraceae bacterium]